jgi:hypothetical protein
MFPRQAEIAKLKLGEPKLGETGIWRNMLRRISNPVAAVLLGAALLYPVAAMAQHGGGGRSAPVPSGPGRPDGVDEKDTLKDFHQAMAVQATSEQIAEFQLLVKSTETAKTRLQTFAQQRAKTSTVSDPVVSGAEIDKSLESVRADSKKFVAGFSEPQRSGLKDITKRLDKADSDLEQEEKKLDQSLQAPNAAGAEVEAHAETLSKALTDFSNQQLALGREMGVVLASGDDVTFNLTTVKSPVNLGNRTLTVPVSGALSQVSVEGGQRTFKLQMIANLSDLQQNITEILRTQLGSGGVCGERLAVRQATIASSSPASVLVLQLHYERWSCIRTLGQSTSNELAEGEGSVEIKLTPTVEKSNSLKLATEYSRIDANGMMGESLRSGDLGDELREKVGQSILSAMQPGMDFKATLPPAVQNSAVAQSAKFQDAGAGELSVVIEGQLEASNDQVNLMASQLNQTLAAQGTATR